MDLTAFEWRWLQAKFRCWVLGPLSPSFLWDEFKPTQEGSMRILTFTKGFLFGDLFLSKKRIYTL